MKKTFCYFSIILITLISATEAHALVEEVRLNYGGTSGSPAKNNSAYFNFQDGPEIYQQTYAGIDAITRTSLLVNYRIIDKKFYVGSIVSYGVAQDLSSK